MNRPSSLISLITVASMLNFAFILPAGSSEWIEPEAPEDGVMDEMNWEGESWAEDSVSLQQDMLNNQWPIVDEDYMATVTDTVVDTGVEPAPTVSDTGTATVTAQSTAVQEDTEGPPIDRDPPLTPEQETAADTAMQEADQLMADIESYFTAGAAASADTAVAQAAPADGGIQQLEESLGLETVTPYEQLRDEIMDSIIDLRQKKEDLASANGALRTAESAYRLARAAETDAFNQVEGDYERWREARDAEGLTIDVGSELGLLERPSDILLRILSNSRDQLRQAREAADAAAEAVLDATTRAIRAALDTSSARLRAQQALDRAVNEYFLPQYHNLSTRLALNRLMEQRGEEPAYSYEELFDEFTGINAIFEAFLYWHDGYFAGGALEEVRQEIDLLHQAFHPTEHPLDTEVEDPYGDGTTIL